MAVNNRIAPANGAKKPQEMIYMLGGQEVKLTPAIVRDYMVSGNKETVTTQEIVMFMNLCKFAGLNPWLKEAYCIKYGNEPATMVTGKAAFLKRADEHPQFDGMESGVITYHEDSATVEYRKGTFFMPDEKIIGGWAEVFRKDQKHSTRIEVSFEEYAGRKKDGGLNGQWAKKPATMIRKVAQVQALREAFPNSFTGMLAAEEAGYDEPIVAEVIAQPEAEAQPVEQTEQHTQHSGAAAALFGGEE